MQQRLPGFSSIDILDLEVSSEFGFVSIQQYDDAKTLVGLTVSVGFGGGRP